MNHLQQLPDLIACLARARREHYRLVWLAGGDPADRSAVLRLLADAEKGTVVDLGKKLSTDLLDVPVPLRPASVEECLFSYFTTTPEVVTCLDHLEILFEPSLRINPVALIQRASRHATIVASWPGSPKDGGLVFGPSDHPAHTYLSHANLESLLHLL